jgi:hypothetical protein
MAYLSLSSHDINVLEKIKDPESSPFANVRIDTALPRDPRVTDTIVYSRIAQKEREILLSIQELELQLAGLRARTASNPIEEYVECVSKLGELVAEHPDYASARNNRVQALRSLYGDLMLVDDPTGPSRSLLPNATTDEKQQAGKTVLDDVETCIALLVPASPQAAISPQAAKTLSLAHTQRAAIYHATAKALAFASLNVDSSRAEARWAKLEFEEAASQDFAMGGRYGNEIAKGLAVSTNPTAKLCGQMVREAMRKEYGESFGA